MRIYLRLSSNTTVVPFNYQQQLVGAFHKWLGENELHDNISLYSLSWLSKGNARKKGLDFPNGSTFYISAPDPDLLSKLVNGVFQGHHICWGMEVESVTIQRTPKFGTKQKFYAQSPILIKRKELGEKHHRYFYPADKESNFYLTETLKQKLLKAGLSNDVSVKFDPEFEKPIIKIIQYRNIAIKASICPVIVEGDPRAVQFAWEVGVGNSTGICFGALK